MRRILLVLLSMGTLLAATACKEEMVSLDSGTPSNLTVRAYVDANGNGRFDSGADQPIAAAEITAAGPGGSFSGTTAADGSATIQGLAPGAYEVTLAGLPPLGAVLATATKPVVVAPFRGATLSTEFRYSFLPGAITGRLYRDDDESGAFEPETDLPAAGISITLTDGGGAGSSGASGAGAAAVELTTTTDAQGAFSFDGLRPGTYTLTIAALETMEIVGGATQTVTVAPDVPLAIDVVFTGTLLISIADARAAPEGQTVTVEGVVTWHPAFDTRVYFLQDGTGGISAFDFNRPDVAIGDRIQITGTRSSFDSELQISPVITFENLGPVGAPDPRTVTAAEINAGLFQGELVTLDGTVQAVDVLSFGNQEVTLRDAAGNDFTVYADSRTGVVEESWTVGVVYAVTGVLGTDDDFTRIHRLEVRSPDDVVAGGSVISIAEARGRDGETVVIQGVITWQTQWDSRVYFLQDATGGISAFHSGAPDLARGDLVQIVGDISAFRGETQIGPANLQILGPVGEPAPRGVTGAEINAGQHQGQLVTVTGVLQDVAVLNFGNQMVTIRDGAGTDFTVFVDSRNGVNDTAWPAPGATVRVSGVLGTDDRNTPAARIELRDIDDLVIATAGQVSLAEARSMPGATVTVEGVVTWQTQWDNRVYFFQDATAGISTFHSGAPDLNEGDRILITGDVTAFRGEVQIGSITAITVLGQEAAPIPRVVTAAQVNSGQFQGELVQVTGTLLSVQELNFGNQRVEIRDASGRTLLVFVDSRNGMVTADWPATGTVVQVVGVLGTDDRTTVPEGTGPRIEPRRVGDVTVPGS